MFLTEPPDERLPVPDFRTVRDVGLQRPSPDLLETIYACELRQNWYREFAEANGLSSVDIVGSCRLTDDPVEAAARLRDALGFELARRVEFRTWTEALSGLIDHAEAVGVLVMVSGVVGNNTHRPLNPNEFRGFSLVDELAPVIFINGADTKAAQIFSLAHELAHTALGGSAVSRPDMARLDEESDRTERWCNLVAAELLVPLESIRLQYDQSRDISDESNRLARFYKVSTLVVLRRLFDAGMISSEAFRETYGAELERLAAIAADRVSGGSFYNTQPVRVSKRFARALISDTKEGRTPYSDAFRLLGSKKLSAFEELGERLGIA